MMDRDNTDALAALAIGAVVGVGVAMLIRSRQEDDTHEVIKRLRPLKRQAQRGARDAGRAMRRQVERGGSAADDLRSAGREIIEELRSTARDVVRETRSELEKSALRAMKDARRKARSAKREFLR